MSFKTIIKLMDIKTLVAGLVPVILGSIYSKYAFERVNILYFLLLAFAMILIQSATNMINDYFDFKRGADVNKSSDEKALISGEVTTKGVLTIIFFYQLIAFIIGVFIASQTSYYILLVAILGGTISILYAFGPMPISYTPIGEIVSGLTMGIGITTTVIYIQSGVFNLSTILVAIPTALFIGTILLTNNLSDIVEDKEAGRKTLPIILGKKNAEKLWMFNVVILFLLTLGLVLINIYPLIILIPVILLFPYKSILIFSSYEKTAETKGRSMGLIGQVGVKYHFSIVIGLVIAIIIR
ncbi:1,4-dihydroxy-2-naphthoate octaprenyltransferase [Clostridium saccharoperbutylacetonicum]|uniref:Putative 1,4-dihydroxy-2-naphthoate octaprenyltransferase MenA n=1 Tax=Clostridium saccharoperbutylacetonicum N1-4(HMT) TaxID=931276 RepID=M1MFD7_9CLOT|nr:prenyltransferase [Clostridium saccharoperbutylacetonicum]AGF56629.1 putative 1,4-dihydroxy-2-naphthoate octaprenyltransferase MenA [Clostridium saccharoperbutylacetonicum N1-4(HMT)]NRT62620.1 1,4-dihydroxy-2-naphthoate octaprenyltransferase [Clostridium saccharoperbutylacetonicum]NSB25967.1 1,4-dihydroxy-2-naphthoate octaprenyltransferase [Clostridium saccharoperbutylacetonicum]NSB45325.1 1,4-dihydroxy-2-naphthoate octaprenyltransferase [Clostridium saccharoperbutylacetonicum]